MRRWRPLAAPRAASYSELWCGGRRCGAAMRQWHCARRCRGPGPRRGRRAARNCPRRNSNRAAGETQIGRRDGCTLYGARAPERLEWSRRRLDGGRSDGGATDAARSPATGTAWPGLQARRRGRSAAGAGGRHQGGRGSRRRAAKTRRRQRATAATRLGGSHREPTVALRRVEVLQNHAF